MKRFEAKLDRPPYVHNWIRNFGPDLQSTTKKIVGLALGFPTMSYAAAVPILIDRIVTSLDRDTALKAAMNTGRVNSREIVSEYVAAFFDYDELRKYGGKPTYDEMIEPFRVGKGVTVPVKPLVNIVEHGRLVPIFSVGWASFPLNRFQLRLLATVLEDAVFSLSDFRNSPGEFICFPKDGRKPDAVRKPLIWKRGDMDLLSPSEMRDSLHMYLDALEAAKKILREMPSKDIPAKDHPATNPDQFRLEFP